MRIALILLVLLSVSSCAIAKKLQKRPPEDNYPQAQPQNVTEGSKVAGTTVFYTPIAHNTRGNILIKRVKLTQDHKLNDCINTLKAAIDEPDAPLFISKDSVISLDVPSKEEFHLHLLSIDSDNNITTDTSYTSEQTIQVDKPFDPSSRYVLILVLQPYIINSENLELLLPAYTFSLELFSIDRLDELLSRQTFATKITEGALSAPGQEQYHWAIAKPFNEYEQVFGIYSSMDIKDYKFASKEEILCARLRLLVKQKETCTQKIGIYPVTNESLNMLSEKNDRFCELTSPATVQLKLYHEKVKSKARIKFTGTNIKEPLWVVYYWAKDKERSYSYEKFDLAQLEIEKTITYEGEEPSIHSMGHRFISLFERTSGKSICQTSIMQQIEPKVINKVLIPTRSPIMFIKFTGASDQIKPEVEPSGLFIENAIEQIYQDGSASKPLKKIEARY